jgi:hypothetical protein
MYVTVVMILLIFVSWAALDEYESRHTYNLGWKIFAGVCSISRFPTLIFFWKYLIRNDSIILFSTGTFLNCAFYAIIVERIFYFFNKKRKSTLVYNK